MDHRGDSEYVKSVNPRLYPSSNPDMDIQTKLQLSRSYLPNLMLMHTHVVSKQFDKL